MRSLIRFLFDRFASRLWCAALLASLLAVAASGAAQDAAAEKKRQSVEAARAARSGIAGGAPVTVPNTNDACASAYVLDLDTYTGNNSFSTTDGSSVCTGTRDVWFSFTAPFDGVFRFDTIGSVIDTVISLHSACPGTTANEIDCQDSIFAEEIGYSMTNGETVYIRIAGYQGETGNYTLTVGAGGLQNAEIDVAIDSVGNFTLARTSSNPSDLSTHLLYGHPFPGTSGTSIWVDGATDWNFSGGTIGTQVSGPDLNTSGSLETRWLFNGVQLTQTLSLVEGPTPGVVDNLLIEYELLNQNASAVEAGVRLFMDTWLGNTDGAGFLVPGLGVVTNESELSGFEIPQFWTSFDSFGAGGKRAQGTLGGDPRAVRPDRVVWGAWPPMTGSTWDYTALSSRSVLSDSAVLLYWEPTTLDPGESRRVATFYGLSAINSDLNAPLAVNLAAPSALDVFNNKYVPNPFTISAYIENSLAGVTTAAQGVYAEITLPMGLELVSGPARVELGTLNVGFGAFANWRIRANPLIDPSTLGGGVNPNLFEYQIEVGTTNAGSKTVTGEITLPYLLNAVSDWSIFE